LLGTVQQVSIISPPENNTTTGYNNFVDPENISWLRVLAAGADFRQFD